MRTWIMAALLLVGCDVAPVAAPADCGPEVRVTSSTCANPDPATGLPALGCFSDTGRAYVGCTHNAPVNAPMSLDTYLALCVQVCP